MILGIPNELYSGIRTFCVEPQNKIRTRKFGYFASLCPINTRPAIKFAGTPGITVGHYKTIIKYFKRYLFGTDIILVATRIIENINDNNSYKLITTFRESTILFIYKVYKSLFTFYVFYFLLMVN